MNEQGQIITLLGTAISNDRIARRKLEIFQNTRQNTENEWSVFPFLRNARLLAPLVDAHIKDGELKVNVLTFVDGSYQLDTSRFTFYQQYTRAVDGSYQLVIYIEFTEINPTTEQVKSLSQFSFEISPETHIAPICPTDLQTFEPFYNTTFLVEEVETVKVFLINTNPRTSRGTETAVQKG